MKRLPAISVLLALSLALAACQGATNQNVQPATGSSAQETSTSADTDWSKHPAHADYMRGLKHQDGRGVPQDDVEAVRWLRRAAEQGHAEAQAFLGRAYEEGKGVARDDAQAARWYRASAKQGFDLGQQMLGVLYYFGQGVPQDHSESAKWFRLAAQQGAATAQLMLGVQYAEGQGVPQDYGQAAKWFRLAAQQGNRNAQYSLGRIYHYGEGVARDSSQAASWLTASAEQGHARAQTLLGILYSTGQGVPQDDREAAKWTRKAAEQNNANAQTMLGLMHLAGRSVRQDDIEAVKWLELSAGNGGSSATEHLRDLKPGMTAAEIAEAERRAEQWRADFRAGRSSVSDAQVAKRSAAPAPAPQPRATTQANQTGGGQRLSTLGAQLPRASLPKSGPAGSVSPAWENARQALARQDYKESARWLRVEAEQGDVAAMGLLGTLYLDRDGVGRDYGEALRWLRPAAEEGDANAQAALGGMYELGRGLPENRAEAARWYRLGAESGNAYAQSRLGTMYMSTSGPMEQDDAQAIKWLRAAAEQNEPHAQAMLGLMYAHGRGVAQDLVTAQVWLNLGGSQGSNFGRVLGPDYAEKLTPAQRTEAERRAEQWLADFRRVQRTANEGQVAARSAAPASAPQPRATAESTRTKPVAAVSPGPAYEKALRALLREDEATAANWLRVEAERGYGPAMGLLGTLYLDGHGVEQDYDEALRWLRPAAKQGDANAQSSLGAMYEFGKGLPKDTAEAARWYRMGAKGGNGYAQYRLGSMYMSTSSPMPQDDFEAVRWLSAAAEQNLAPAQALLGSLYGEGRGVKEDLVTAQMWLTLATTQGDSFGRIMGELNAEQMTAAEIAEAERRAATWLRDFQSRQPG